jgi:hypothetical protein
VENPLLFGTGPEKWSFAETAIITFQDLEAIFSSQSFQEHPGATEMPDD